MPVSVPVPNEFAFFRQTTQLDGVEYVLLFQFNQRMCCWYVSIFDEDDEPIVVGRRLNVDVPIGRGVRDDRFPEGRLMTVDQYEDLAAGKADPGFTDLGVRHLLLYFEESEVAA